MKILEKDADIALFHSTEKKSVNQQTGPDGAQSVPALTHSQRPRVDGGMLMSAGQ